MTITPNKTLATIGDWMRRSFSISTLPMIMTENMTLVVVCYVLAGVGDLLNTIYK